MKRNTLVGIAVLAALGGLITATSIQAREKEGPQVQVAQEISDTLMQQKLQHAQALLSALSVADYEGMVMHARELERISLEARWSQPHSTAYAGFGDDFRNALDRLSASAQKQNIDGAALNYVQVVLTCIECHKVVRESESLAQNGSIDALNFSTLGAGD